MVELNDVHQIFPKSVLFQVGLGPAGSGNFDSDIESLQWSTKTVYVWFFLLPQFNFGGKLVTENTTYNSNMTDRHSVSSSKWIGGNTKVYTIIFYTMGIHYEKAVII